MKGEKDEYCIKTGEKLKGEEEKENRSTYTSTVGLATAADGVIALALEDTETGVVVGGAGHASERARGHGKKGRRWLRPAASCFGMMERGKERERESRSVVGNKVGNWRNL